MSQKSTTCPVCDTFFPDAYQLAKHCTTALHSDNYRASCKFCSATFGCTKDWGVHFLSAHEKAAIACPICRLPFPTNYDLAQHCLAAHKDCKFPCQCRICLISYTSASEWGAHYADTHMECPVCGVDFKSLYELAKHSSMHSERLGMECRLCEGRKGFESFGEWGEHVSSFHAHCLLCVPKRSFASLLQLANHCERVHDGQLYNCACKLCGKKFGNAAKWGKHFQKHFLERKTTDSAEDCTMLKLEMEKLKKDLLTQSNTIKQLVSSEIQFLNKCTKAMQTSDLKTEASEILTKLEEQLKTTNKSTNDLVIDVHTPQATNQKELIKMNIVQHLEKTQWSCVLCWEETRRILAYPCGHLLYCGKCYNEQIKGKILDCAICRETAKEYIKLFI
eukprot:TRINITY_DN5887_c0_g1_i1.p1 TRINITY_DN5887_c0_g1~~TRINITY_DN5887_c0_g1_i1.p1  ORF type:complete len:391 (+),score=60.70 TRINITY_DN5887_c0_g1_i1:61-1233(+)